MNEFDLTEKDLIASLKHYPKHGLDTALAALRMMRKKKEKKEKKGRREHKGKKENGLKQKLLLPALGGIVEEEMMMNVGGDNDVRLNQHHFIMNSEVGVKMMHRGT